VLAGGWGVVATGFGGWSFLFVDARFG
jgi:hypothetical protein